MTDDDIDYSDIPPTTDWTGAVRGKFYRPERAQVTLPIDRDVLAWFRESGNEYQAAVNAVLREYVARRRRAS